MKNYIILSLVFVWLNMSCTPNPSLPTLVDDLKGSARTTAPDENNSCKKTISD